MRLRLVRHLIAHAGAEVNGPAIRKLRLQVTR